MNAAKTFARRNIGAVMYAIGAEARREAAKLAMAKGLGEQEATLCAAASD